MIIEPKVEKLLEKSENRYQLVIAVAKRARQIVDGDKPKIKTKEKSAVTVSSIEMLEDEVKIL